MDIPANQSSYVVYIESNESSDYNDIIKGIIVGAKSRQENKELDSALKEISQLKCQVECLEANYDELDELLLEAYAELDELQYELKATKRKLKEALKELEEQQERDSYMEITKTQVDILIDELNATKSRGLLAKLKGDKDTHEKAVSEFNEIVEYLIAVSYANHIEYGTSRHIHKRLLDVMELEEYQVLTKKIAQEIDEYNNL